MDSLRSAKILAMMAIAALPVLAKAETEEQRLVRIAKMLKPISDSQWSEIAGPKTTDTYDIQKGDTLWDISKRLFGNSFYWPKVWSLNGAIPNPHFVNPGQKLAFMAGSSESTPKLAPSEAGSSDTSTKTPEHDTVAAKSENGDSASGHEYDKLPADRWAPKDLTKKLKLQEEYDKYGIDKELKISLPQRFAMRIPAIANDTTVPFLGEIVGSRREAVGLSQGETVFLKSNSQDLQVGSTYSVLGDPEFVRERRSDRSGYVYGALGEIRIIGVKDELYIGLIVKAYDVIERGDRLYPLLPMISEIKPLPSRTAIEALTTFGSSTGTHDQAQFRFVHFDRGIEDGVQVGNVFRLYDYFDPETKKKITDSDFLINADALVVHATAQFSTALVIRSRDTFARGDFGVLLTDVTDITRQLVDRSRNFGESDTKTPEDKELDELDQLDRDTGEGLGRKEETEIKELDQWDKSKDLQNGEPTIPSAADTPTDEAEKLPTREQAPKEPSLDETLDSPTATPPGVNPPAPPANLAPQPEQTLDAPPPPPSEETPVTGEAAPSQMPEAEPITPDAPPPVEPIQPTTPDDVEIKR